MEDITLRTLKTLRKVDAVYCEDTRHSLILLNRYNIKKPLFSLFEHDEAEKSLEIIEKLGSGQDIAYISDAGMPGISDPGAKLINLAIKENLELTVLPGASALITAVVGSGLETDSFLFCGFLPKSVSKRKEYLAEIADCKQTMIFYIAPHNAAEILGDIIAVLGDRKGALARELTKKFEQYVREDLSVILNKLDSGHIICKGEMVLVVSGSHRVSEISDEYIIKMLSDKLHGKCSKKDAVRQISQEFNISKNRVYTLSLKL